MGDLIQLTREFTEFAEWNARSGLTVLATKESLMVSMDPNDDAPFAWH